MFKHPKEFGWSFCRGVLGRTGGRRNLLMLAILLVTTWMLADIYHFNTVSELPIAVVDMDRTSLSRTIARYLDASTMLSVSPATPGGIEEARRMLVDGDVCAVVVIPGDLSTNIKRGHQADLMVAVDNSNILIGKNAATAISVVTGTVNAGIRIRTLQKLGDSADDALARVVPLVTGDNLIFNAAKSYSTYLAPGLILFFLQIYMILLFASVIRSKETRLRQAGIDLGLVVHGTLVGLFLLYAYLPAQGIAIHSGMPAIAAVLALNFINLAILGIGVKKLFRGEVFSMQVSVFLGMLSMMFSGITWPTDSFPLPLRLISYVLPYTPMSWGMRILLHFPAGFADIADVLRFFAGQAVFYACVISLVILVETFVGSIVRRRRTRVVEEEG